MDLISIDEIRWYNGSWWTGYLWYNHANDREVWQPRHPV